MLFKATLILFVMGVCLLPAACDQKMTEWQFHNEIAIRLCRSVAWLLHLTDTELLSFLHFKIPIRSSSDSSSTTYAVATADGKVLQLNIVNEDYVPYGIFCLQSLKQLSIRNTCFYEPSSRNPSVRRAPALIRYLAPTLEYLLIQDTPISHLPDEIGQLKNLIFFEMSNTGLESLPDTIGDLPSLNVLYLPYNNLSSLPATLKKNSKLRQVVVSDNPKLRSLEPLNGHPSLEILTADDCAIDQLPLRLPMLYDLSMSNNSLTNLNGIKTLGEKTNKQKQFRFDHNQIKSISPEVKQVKNLRHFNVNSNPLVKIPFDIFQMKKHRVSTIQ